MKKLAGLILVVIFVIILIFGFGFISESFLDEPLDDAENIAFSVEEGESTQSIAARLKELDLISDTERFLAFKRIFAKEDIIQAGEFELKKGMSFKSLVESLGEAIVNEVEITIPEGFTLKQVEERVLSKFPHITAEEWNSATGVDSPLKSEGIGTIIPENHDLEGYLFPDTYRFFEDETAIEIATEMFKNFESKVEGLEVNHEIITLASIVEREVRTEEEMRRVAEIFKRRLEIGMPLQADSTLNYITGNKDSSAKATDLSIDSPYNTYKYNGLPPGPISHPGLKAIKAVVDPEPNNWLYFLTTPEGEVIYAETFEEHVRNKAEHLR